MDLGIDGMLEGEFFSVFFNRLSSSLITDEFPISSTPVSVSAPASTIGFFSISPFFVFFFFPRLLSCSCVSSCVSYFIRFFFICSMYFFFMFYGITKSKFSPSLIFSRMSLSALFDMIRQRMKITVPTAAIIISRLPTSCRYSFISLLMLLSPYVTRPP